MNHVQLLLSNSKQNITSCGVCNKEFKNAHLLCIKFYKKDKQIYWINKYTVGCSHVEFYGTPWCRDCVTIADQKIMCQECGNLYRGIPQFTGNNLKYMWNDGSESCFQDFQLK